MPAARVRLYIRPSLPDGKRPFLDPVYTAHHKLKSGSGVLDGREQRFTTFAYYLRYLKSGKRVWELAGSDAAVALDRQRRVRHDLEDIALGCAKPDAPERTERSEPTPEPPQEQEPAAADAERKGVLVVYYTNDQTRWGSHASNTLNTKKPPKTWRFMTLYALLFALVRQIAALRMYQNL